MRKHSSDADLGVRARYIPVPLLLLLLGFLVAACGSAEADLAVGDPAPSFSLPAASGEEVALDDYHGEQPVLLYFHMADG